MIVIVRVVVVVVVIIVIGLLPRRPEVPRGAERQLQARRGVLRRPPPQRGQHTCMYIYIYI